ncbi:hypothetical protein D3OALGB2SA_1064 [Olavius algarvensis associated proteobacterium Delta 3]|nr:hypothetical protein D3OALGB2SA_1064 [Olavius algarvensis associated proteobacterium Delta 3]
MSHFIQGPNAAGSRSILIASEFLSIRYHYKYSAGRNDQQCRSKNI